MTASSQGSPARRRRGARAVSAAGLLLVSTVSFAQVRYFDRPPTAEQLREALLARPRAEPSPMVRPADANGIAVRGIRWNDNSAVPAGQDPAKADAQTVTRPPAARADADASGPAAAMPINFDSGSARVSAGSFPYLDAVAQVLQADPSMKVVIEGHTDASGPATRNMMLSWERAYSVFRLLVERYGIDPARLQPLGRGSLDPIDGATPTDGVNRRVQFRLHG